MEQEQVEEIEEKGLATRDFHVRNEEATGSIPVSSTNFNHLQTPKIQPVTLLSHLTQPWPKFAAEVCLTNSRSDPLHEYPFPLVPNKQEQPEQAPR